MAGKLELARDHYLLALAVRPGNPDVVHLLGVLYSQRGKHVIGLELLLHALSFFPNSPPLLANIALACKGAGRFQDAIGYYERALEIDPDFHSVRGDLVGVMAHLADQAHKMGNRGEAIALHLNVLKHDPLHAWNLNNMAIVLQEMGRIDEALDAYRAALTVPDPPDFVLSNYLLALHLSTATTQREYSAAATGFFSNRHPAPPVLKRYPLRSDRPLRVGYISADFSGHAVSTFILPLLAEHDPLHVDVQIFSNGILSPDIASWLKTVVKGLHGIQNLGDEQALALIRETDLDLLVDLSGHTAGNRLSLLARRAAPVQATWLGYFNTTGVPAMDYVLADARSCPPRLDIWFTERIVRLPASFFCYTPINMDIPCTEAPSLSGAPFTFGCLNETSKLNRDLLLTWSVILRRVPGSRLLLRAKGFADASIVQWFQSLFQSHGIAPDRLTLLGPVPRVEYLRTFQKIDLCLDPFPYNGGTVTCDALWMGVPVLTWAGEMMVSRMGCSILHAARMDRLVTLSRHDYIAKAVELARYPEKLRNIRIGLRDKMRSSDLCNTGKFMTALIKAYRTMVRNVSTH